MNIIVQSIKRKKKNIPEIWFRQGVFYEQVNGQEVYSEQSLFDYLMKYILVVCGSVGVLLSVMDSFSIPGEIGAYIGFILLWSILFSVLFFGKKRGRYVELIISGGILVFILLTFSNTVEGLRYLYSQVAVCYNNYYGINLPFFDVSEITQAQIRCGIALFILPITLCMAKAMGIRTNLIWATVALFPTVALELLCGHMSTPFPMFLILGSYLIIVSLCLTAFCGIKRRMPDEKISLHEMESDCPDCIPDAASVAGIRGTAISLMAALIMMSAYLGYGFFYQSVENIFSPIRHAVYTSSVKDLLDELRNGYSRGGINGGDLSGSGRIQFDGSVHLEVTYNTPVPYTYLKGYVGGAYTGRTWQDFPNSVYNSQVWQDLMQYGEERIIGYNYELLSFVVRNKENFSIRYTNYRFLETLSHSTVVIDLADAGVRGGEYLCMPPHAYVTEEDGEIVSGSYLTRKSQDALENAYDFYYWDENNLSMMYEDMAYMEALMESGKLVGVSSGTKVEWEELKEIERLYRQFVYSNYLEVSDSLSKLKTDYEGVRFNSIGQAVEYVQEELAKNATYSLEPGKVPFGKDYIEYFFYENKKGYCTHFASTGVELFRILGIPARFVQGYLVPPGKAGVTIEVDDSCAHAWVEIYVNGFGWIPVEVTPGLNGEAGGFTPEMNLGGVQSGTPEPGTPEETQTEESTAEERTTEEPTTEDVTENTTEEATSEDDGGTTKDEVETENSAEESRPTDNTERDSTERQPQTKDDEGQTDPKPGQNPSGGSNSPGSGVAPDQEGNPPEEGTKPHLVPMWLLRTLQWISGVVLLLLIVVFLVNTHRRTRLAARNQRFKHRNCRQGILNIYTALCTMTKKYGKAIDEDCSVKQLAEDYPVLSEDYWAIVQRTVIETAYSAHEVSDEDRDRVLYAYRVAARFLCGKLNWRRKLWFCYWDCYR